MTLDDWCTANNLSSRRLAELLGLSAPMTAHRYRRGRIPRDRALLRKIVEVTNGEVTLDDFFGGDNDNEPPPRSPSSSAAFAASVSLVHGGGHGR